MTIAQELVYVRDLGMFVFDRPIPVSCTHQTEFCKKTCYNNKLYKLYDLTKRDARCEEAWQNFDVSDLKWTLERKRRKTDRIRLMSRGESLSDYRDPRKLRELCEAIPDTLVWVPTRAWRKPLLRAQANVLREEVANLRLLASIDPTTTAEEYQSLIDEGWSTMGYGEGVEQLMRKPFKCPKTFKKIKEHCSSCKGGCFSDPVKRRVDVWLKQH